MLLHLVEVFKPLCCIVSSAFMLKFSLNWASRELILCFLCATHYAPHAALVSASFSALWPTYSFRYVIRSSQPPDAVCLCSTSAAECWKTDVLSAGVRRWKILSAWANSISSRRLPHKLCACIDLRLFASMSSFLLTLWHCSWCGMFDGWGCWDWGVI